MSEPKDSTIQKEATQESGSGVEAAPTTIYFDGVCGLCNWFVDLLLKADRHGRLRFAPLQGQTAGERLDEGEVQSLNTMVLVDGSSKYLRSGAVLRGLAHSGGLWKLALLLLLVPYPLRDLFYNIVAHNRYAWFGQRDTCRMPSPEERKRFLP